jgi:hypothetical protein
MRRRNSRRYSRYVRRIPENRTRDENLTRLSRPSHGRRIYSSRRRLQCSVSLRDVGTKQSTRIEESNNDRYLENDIYGDYRRRRLCDGNRNGCCDVLSSEADPCGARADGGLQKHFACHVQKLGQMPSSPAEAFRVHASSASSAECGSTLGFDAFYAAPCSERQAIRSSCLCNFVGQLLK